MSRETPVPEPDATSDERGRPTLTPFADEASVVTLGGLTFENGRDRIAVHGSLDLTRDRRGLDHARTLHALLGAIVTTLEASDLPETADDPAARPTRAVANPFA